MLKKVMAASCLLAALALGLSACGSNDTQLNDAPVGKIDDAPTFVMTNADGFPNVAFRCKGVNGIYTTTREGAGALHIVANDPECKGNPEWTQVSG